ncbi:Bacterial alpha-L-rhamnosidase [Gracilibacillus oryzae]|uniref:Bacterial alpha-L-rhamnosidase n=1 Tax=Gracilibacillus oryzae TaxID=1672701 RepID=A0A7C8GU18_9BACI|nr:amylo-alpha-1,6-glucosidase [Gracilibacillus oryzae]KAB8137854.1 Bacterial alpha-L-rhamnosidase [Gracilibacillus oryzae]
MNMAYWIWYPGDWEVWLHEKISVQREMRGAIYPPFWRLDRHYSSVIYKYKYVIDQPEMIDIVADGTFAAFLDGRDNYRTNQGQLRLPAGEHELTITVYNRVNVPAIYVSGETVFSNDQWQVSCYDQNWHTVGNWKKEFNTSEKMPSLFRLPRKLEEPITVDRRSDSIFIDFGKEMFGYLQLEKVKGEGELTIYYGESVEEAEDKENCILVDKIAFSDDEESMMLEKSRAFRYVQIVPSEKIIEIGNVHLQYEYLPVENRSYFQSSDSLLNQIWETSLYTLHLNTREFFYDGIKRDRWVWSGDAYQSFLMDYYSFFDCDVVKRTLTALRGKDPVVMHINTILDYSLYWFIGIYDYYMYSGDLEFVKSQYDRMISLMDFCLARRNENSMMEGIENDWVFVDWADIDNRGEVSTIQILLCRSLQTMALVAELLEDEERKIFYENEAEMLKDKIMETFWDEEKGGLIHHRVNNQRNEKITKYPNIFALSFGYFTDLQKEKVKQQVMLNPQVQAIKTPYMRFFELAALCEVGEHSFVLDEISAYWGGMLKLGATTFWEEYDPQLSGKDHLKMYDMPYGKSLCHAWGASPIYLIGKYFLGVRPLSPGYHTFAVEPHLGGLKWFKGTIPIGQGEVEIHMNHEQIKVRTTSGAGILKYEKDGKPFEVTIPNDSTWLHVNLV